MCKKPQTSKGHRACIHMVVVFFRLSSDPHILLSSGRWVSSAPIKGGDSPWIWPTSLLGLLICRGGNRGCRNWAAEKNTSFHEIKRQFTEKKTNLKMMHYVHVCVETEHFEYNKIHSVLNLISDSDLISMD